MKTFIKIIKIGFASIFMFTMSSCNIFENFLFNVPLTYTFESTGALTLSDEDGVCLEEDGTYENVKDKINQITFVEGYIVVLSINPQNIEGDVTFTLYGGTSPSGTFLAQYSLNDVSPADYSPNSPLKIDLDDAQIQAVNDYLANPSNVRCFFGTFEVTDIVNGGITNSITVRVDVLFSVDADL